MRIVPLGDHVVVKRLDAEETTTGGVILPESAQSPPQQGRVLSVGDGRTLPDGSRAAPMVGEGDRVLFPQYSGQELLIDGQKLLILREDDLLAIVH
ncbi:MAG: co-chaperone GroES [Planctomycetes bacterium]|nr:co-chaperone GroES [Planctomycetota bacterium]